MRTVPFSFASRGSLLAAMLLAMSWTAAAAPVARADRVVVRENAPPGVVDVLANDTFDPALMLAGELRISSPPMGSAVVQTRGTATAADDRIVYRPPVNFTGDDIFSYQVCESGVGGGCSETQLHVTVRPAVDQYEETATGAGHVDVAIAGLRPLPEAHFRATRLVAPAVDTVPLAVDPTPASIWDNGMAGTGLLVRTIPEPSNGVPQRWRILVDAAGSDGDIDVYVGLDLNGNSLPDPGELKCTAAMSTVKERCEVAIVHPANGQPRRYWTVLHNRAGVAQSARVETFQVYMDGTTDGTLVATGPGTVPGLVPFELRIAWTDARWLPGESRAGYVRVLSGTNETGVFPIRIDRTGELAAATILGRGPIELRLAPGAAQDRMFFDVPAGATSFRVNTFSAQNIDLYLAHVDAPSSPGIDAAPPRDQADASATGPSGNEALTISGAQLLPGRWYVTPVNAGPIPAQVTVQVMDLRVDTVPLVRPGSYFNPARSGHGVFLYPAADQRTGLWYTYFQDRTPTWYYLQALQPNVTGIWSSEVFRAAWDGDSRELTPVGRVILTPTGDDAFIWSYRIDGETGSETMQALGRGCPMLQGDVVDSSSTWFDPGKPGTGHSVQLFDDYEFYASFVYDALGVPRFVTAERTSFGDEDELIDLEQLTGFCPLCERTGDPERETIGVFGRSYANGTLTDVALAGVFTDGVPGTWSQDDEVQALGGPGTTQGCEP